MLYNSDEHSEWLCEYCVSERLQDMSHSVFFFPQPKLLLPLHCSFICSSDHYKYCTLQCFKWSAFLVAFQLCTWYWSCKTATDLAGFKYIFIVLYMHCTQSWTQWWFCGKVSGESTSSTSIGLCYWCVSLTSVFCWSRDVWSRKEGPLCCPGSQPLRLSPAAQTQIPAAGLTGKHTAVCDSLR